MMLRTVTMMAAIAVASAVAAGATVKGSGKSATETRELPVFDAIELKVAVDVSVTIGEPSAMTLTGDDNLLGLITTEVKDGTLVIDANEQFRSKRGINVTVGVKSLRALEIRGSGDVKVSGLDSEKFSVGLKGSGDAYLDGRADALVASLDGSCDLHALDLQTSTCSVKIAGSGDAKVNASESLSIAIDGSGDVYALDTETANCSVNIRGSGDVKVNVSESLSIAIEGSGDVHYKGAAKVTQAIAGSGDVKKVG